MNKKLKIALGIILIIIGIPGLILPIIPGIILIAIGLTFLGHKNFSNYFKRKFT